MSRIVVVESEVRSSAAGRLGDWPVRDFAAAREDLQPDLLLLVRLNQASDLDRASELLQVRCLRQVPCTIWLLAPAVRLTANLTEADQVFLGPEAPFQAAEAARQWLRRIPADLEAVGADLARRLAPWTPSLAVHADRLALAADHDVTVLLTGETGSGKTHLARLLHESSPRRGHRFMVVPCGAIAPNLVESEFFGHVKGAFTGADRARVGRVAAGGEGTLLLDEVDVLSLEQQARLLRIVEAGEFEPVGSHETQRWQGRLIVASNRDLAAEVQAGRFREDLYYRLGVMHFQLPPLRERPGDLPALIRGLAARYAVKFRRPIRDVAPDVFELLLDYSWPGNLRQLENTLQAAVLMATGDVLKREHLPQLDSRSNGGNLAAPRPFDSETTKCRNRELTERRHIERALARHGGSRTQAARSLGISRVTLYKKMKKYCLLPGPTLAAAG